MNSKGYYMRHTRSSRQLAPVCAGRYRRTSGSKGPTGFTLVEMMVVIAIITLLAVLLLPVFTLAKGKSQQATCSSNLRQLGMAMQQYTQDSDERLPCGVVQSGGCS